MTEKEPFYKTNIGIATIILSCCVVGVILFAIVASLTAPDSITPTTNNETNNLTREKATENLTFKDNVRGVLSRFDTNNDLKLSELEFTVWELNTGINSRGDIFMKYDLNKDKYIDIHELNNFHETVESYN